MSDEPVEWPWAARKVKHMPPPMTRASTMSSRARMTPILSRTLEPPRTATYGRRGSSRTPRRASPSSARRAGQELRRGDDGGVGPVGGAEGVVHVGVDARDELLHEGGVVARLAGIEPQVLPQLDTRCELGEPLSHRVHRVPGIGRALGP